MEQRRTTVQKTGTYIGLMTGIAAIVYHLLLVVTGLSDMVSLHFLTGIILVIGVCWGIKRHKTHQNGRINYLEGVGVGFIVGIVSSIIYTIAQVIGDYVFNMAYSYPYMADDTYGSEPAIWLMAVTWILFGAVLGPFIAYLAMQYFKNPDHKLTS
ncbi:DUF4199 domain-containing protein [Rufibacter immobilis]|uniref:DUF4199 domain-containing protein n=1 Tax=Rufibacter immobilis TaxID=1348778 RepID=A0A3M9MQX2_9BACT|nr:DUF4199 domain-containing protein [Rufibacter immobilis]RNI27597.1 DUF4199 domain-containing protein [Rufibacter immobilis]